MRDGSSPLATSEQPKGCWWGWGLPRLDLVSQVVLSLLSYAPPTPTSPRPRCSRLYWSTVDARRRCWYRCRILEYRPWGPREEPVHLEAAEENQTIVHSPAPSSGMALERAHFFPECCPPQAATHQALFSCALVKSQDVCHCSVCCSGGSLRLTSCQEVRREAGAP